MSYSQPRMRHSVGVLSKIDWWLMLVTLVLVVGGLVFLYEASVVTAVEVFQNHLHYVALQTTWIGVGIFLSSILLLMPFAWIRPLVSWFFVVCLGLLVVVLIPGIGREAGGARSWLNLGFTLQPAELVKLSLALYLAALFEHDVRLIRLLVPLGLVSVLIMLQPDLGSLMVIGGVCVGMYLVAGAKWSSLFGFMAAAAAVVAGLIVTAPYRLARLTTLFDISLDPQGSSYHIRQILMALGSGGWFGQGIGQSLQRFNYLPEVMTDSIFAIIGEELGFVGAVVVMLLYIVLGLRGLAIARAARTKYFQLVATGATLIILVQAAANIGAMVALIPLTGIPLPFISYGGSSMVVSLLTIALLQKIHAATTSR